MNPLEPVPKHDRKRYELLLSTDQKEYLENLSYRTGLDMSQLVRLMIVTMRESPEFQRWVDEHSKPRMESLLYIRDWRQQGPAIWRRP